MIRPPGFTGAAFGTRETGDLRADAAKRAAASAELGIPASWAFVKQVHGATVVEAVGPGMLGEADAIVTAEFSLPIAVATADCVPVIIEAPQAVAVVHAGWRGALAGVLPAALAMMRDRGHRPERAAVGPAIGPCCYEVGEEVAALFEGFVASTSWGTTSVDIPAYLVDGLAGLEVWRSGECTHTSDRFNSWRRDRTRERQVAVAWLPSN